MDLSSIAPPRTSVDPGSETAEFSNDGRPDALSGVLGVLYRGRVVWLPQEQDGNVAISFNQWFPESTRSVGTKCQLNLDR